MNRSYANDKNKNFTPSTILTLLLIALGTAVALYAVPFITGPINEQNLKNELNSLQLQMLGFAESENFTNKSMATDAELVRRFPVGDTLEMPDRQLILGELKRQGYTITENTASLIQAHREDYKITLELQAADGSTSLSDQAPGRRVHVSLIKY
ncbi:hypothetical protein JNJ66_01635 [Candidatus Saccharibacteria bacterium]|nr:hypothetical protein [Candidatus Saccharibacteria bacterium]